MFDEELDRINRQIHKLENQADGIIDGVTEAMINALRDMKKGIERKIQKHEMKKEADNKFEQHADSRKEYLENKIHYFRGTFGKELGQFDRDITKSYEAASADKVKENIDNVFNELWQIKQDFMIINSTIRMKP